MMDKKAFDEVIKSNLTKKEGEFSFGYDIQGKTYYHYYSNDAFRFFCSEMEKNYEDAYEEYAKGKGSELKERDSRYGTMPPKMASVGSSSRFCYLALRDGTAALGGSGKVKFEYGCKIDTIDGMPPQLDAFVKDDLIFIEVKCHEIFDSHKITMSRNYWQLIYGDNNQFGLTPASACDGEKFDIPLSVFGIEKTCTRFDIKQLLCHLMGVASYKGDGRTKKLIYLFFKPLSDSNQVEINEVFDCLKTEIDTIFQSEPITRFCKINGIELQAFAEEANIMTALTKENIIELHG